MSPKYDSCPLILIGTLNIEIAIIDSCSSNTYSPVISIDQIVLNPSPGAQEVAFDFSASGDSTYCGDWHYEVISVLDKNGELLSGVDPFV